MSTNLSKGEEEEHVGIKVVQILQPRGGLVHGVVAIGTVSGLDARQVGHVLLERLRAVQLLIKS